LGTIGAGKSGFDVSGLKGSRPDDEGGEIEREEET